MPEIVSKVVSRHKNLCPDIQNLCPDIQKLVLAGAVKVISKVIAHVKPPLKAQTDIHRPGQPAIFTNFLYTDMWSPPCSIHSQTQENQ